MLEINVWYDLWPPVKATNGKDVVILSRAKCVMPFPGRTNSFVMQGEADSEGLTPSFVYTYNSRDKRSQMVKATQSAQQ